MTAIIDTDVRRTWQIAADKVRIEGRHWSETLTTIVARAAEGLGVTEPVTAEFYKLLVYDAGGFFTRRPPVLLTQKIFARREDFLGQ